VFLALEGWPFDKTVLNQQNMDYYQKVYVKDRAIVNKSLKSQKAGFDALKNEELSVYPA